ncbi:mitochondrial carrier [Yasminevirus sp. GU-2018]|uniref:Mitochondrial carrier n=1 Tax=Yasminevirus sp. GU-2018 TaxID=2420051 RepID=A0A5K0U8V4_9VIRU|nr:mitochondrial carrier [Yasminevirus sp. GU-2018]
MFYEPQISVLSFLSDRFSYPQLTKCASASKDFEQKLGKKEKEQSEKRPVLVASAGSLPPPASGVFGGTGGSNNPDDPNNKKRREFLANVVGGCVQATLVTITGYPFDLVKSRLQSGMYPNSMSCITGTIRNEGFIGLYRGSAMPWLSHMLKRPVQYPISEYFKKKVGESGVTKSENTFYNYLIGGATGLLGPVFGTPLQVVKVSMQTSMQAQNQSTSNSDAKMKNSWEYIKYNYNKNGIKGFYRGFVPTAMKDSVYGASFIGTYYTLRDAVGTDAWYKNFFSGATAHCITWCIFMPIDFVKTAVQKSEKKVSIAEVVKTSYRAHGVTVFWKGVIPACLRTIPVSGVAMMGYERIRSVIMNDNK